MEARNFRLTWFLEKEGLPQEEIRMTSGSFTLFLEGDGGFGRLASGAASPIALSCESAVCSRALS
jgi:hypothetical protein